MVLRKKQKQEKAFIAMPPSSSNPLAINGEKEENTAVAPALLEANSDLECAEGGAFFSGTAEAARSSSTISGRGKCDVNPGLAPDGAAVAPAPVHIVSCLRGGADDESDVEDSRCLPCSSSSGGDPPVVSARGPPSGFPGVGGSVATAAPFAAAAVTPQGQKAQFPTGSIRVTCPYVHANGKRCTVTFPTTDGFKPSNLMKFNTHVQQNKGHLKSEVPPLAALWLPEDWGTSCPFPGCTKRLSTRFGLRSTWMKKHFTACHAGENLEAHAELAETRHLSRLRGGDPSQTASASQEPQGSAQTPSSASSTPVFALNAPLDPPSSPTPSEESDATVVDPGLQVPSQVPSSQATTAMATQSTAPSTPTQSPPPSPGGDSPLPSPGRGSPPPSPSQGSPARTPPRRGAPGPGDLPPNQFAHFRDCDWDWVCNWRGLTFRTIPKPCRSKCRDLVNEVFKEASTGDIAAIKAYKCFARAVLFKPLSKSTKVVATVNNRMERWAAGDFESLMSDVRDYEARFAAIGGQRNPDAEAARVRLVESRVAIGEISKGHEAALPHKPFDGPLTALDDLHPEKGADSAMDPPPANAATPGVCPKNFYRVLCEVSRGTSQTADGWHTDLLKCLNVAPTEEVEDPLYGVRLFAISFAAGALPVTQEIYTILAGAKLVALAKPGTDKPRPVGITGVLHRLGMGALLREDCHSGPLARHFADQKEFGTGVPGVCQIIAWSFKMASEHTPNGVMFWADISNGFNCMLRKAIAEGLADLPPELQWLRRSFHAFYAEDVKLFFNRDGDTHVVLSSIGNMQGDPAGGIWFDAGIQRAFNQLRAEFPEVFLAKYFDDVNGFIPPADDGSVRTCLTTEPRAQSLPNSFSPEGEADPAEVPLARALCSRWKFLAKSLCGLDIKKKWGVSSAGAALLQADYGDPQEGGIPVVDGLLVAGVPVGPPAFVAAATEKAVSENVASSFAAISSLPKAQVQNLLARMCGGNARVQHLWQVVNPVECSAAQEDTDRMTIAAVAVILGLKAEDFVGFCQDQSFLPMRFGGLGFTKATSNRTSTFLGGFCTATLGDYDVTSIMPFLAADVQGPESSALPSMVAVTAAWSELLLGCKRLWTLARAAAAEVIRPPSAEPEDEAEGGFPKQLLDQEIRYEAKFKSQAVRGRVPGQGESSCDDLTAAVESRSLAEFQSEGGNWSDLQRDQFDNPEDHPSVLRKWRDQGGAKFQKTFSRNVDMCRFLKFFADVGLSPNGLKKQALFRAQLNRCAAVPLSVLPNQKERQFSNARFQWILCNRIQAPQPCVASFQHERCTCPSAPVIGDDNGRHVRRCNGTDVQGFVHDGFRDETNVFLRSAGFAAVLEKKRLLPDEPSLRPADNWIPDWTIDGVRQKDHAVDGTHPVVETRWDSLSLPAQQQRAASVGVVAEESVVEKRNKKGSRREQAARGNDFSMEQRCLLRNIHFWPMAIEADGAMSKSFISFFNLVCDAANGLTGQNPAAFKNYWWKRLCCRFHQLNSAASLMAAGKIRKKLLRVPGVDPGVLQLGELQQDEPSHVCNRGSYRERVSIRRRAPPSRARVRPLI
jgi:hypothetical protein